MEQTKGNMSPQCNNNSFTAIDFETAQGKRWSICQVGLVRVENQIITEQFLVALNVTSPGLHL